MSSHEDAPAAEGSKYRGGCAPGMRVGREGIPGCHSTCLHRQSVEAYRDTRHAWEALRESGTLVSHSGTEVAAYQLEDDDFRERFPPPTFKDWLISRARPA